ncbi:hypothetical protein Tco_0769262 [Tanacetum coccineum]|uniref:Uncharacterized protein n=1 Tax=Tanacetum coccineum TaxID=301880 RepID=A0ABQ4ZBJ7_9ASTR
MSTPVSTSSTDSQMHNNIMAAGSKDRPPMLGPGRYSQWRSRFLRYIDTKNNGEGLKKCILNGPYVPTSVLIQAVPEAEGRPAVQQHTALIMDPETSQRTKKCKRNWHSLKSISEVYKTYNKNFELLQTPGNTTEIPHMVVQTELIQCFNCMGYGHMKGMQEAKAAEHADWYEDRMKRLMNRNWKHITANVKFKRHWIMIILQTKLNDNSRSICSKDIEIKEGLKTKAYEISVLNQKHDELVKKSLLTKSQLEGYLKENTKVISDLKVKEDKDIDKMIEMDKQLKFLNEIVYTRNQSIQTIHMLAPKCSTYNGRPTFANPRYLKKAQSEKPCLYEIPYDTSDPANRFAPEREETMTLDNEKVDELESEKADFSNMYDLLLEECVSKDVICSYLHSLSELNAHTELQCMYLHKVKECECLAQKLSKQTESVNNEVHNKLLKSFAKLEKHSISLELSLQHCKEQMKNNPVCKENASNVFRKEREQYHEIQDLKAQMQDKNMVINELKKTFE